jgi:hypothetical protein
MKIPNKDYKVSGRIMIQDGKTSHIRRFKTEMEHNGNIADPEFEAKILDAFKAEIREEATQSTLPVTEKPDASPKKINEKKADAKK